MFDFQVGVDKLLISTSIFGNVGHALSSASAYGNGTVLSSGNDVIFLTTVSFGTLTAGDFILF